MKPRGVKPQTLQSNINEAQVSRATFAQRLLCGEAAKMHTKNRVWPGDLSVTADTT
jgi:hypothetical protein